MPEQSCKSCDYFTNILPGLAGDGDCEWTDRTPVPICLPNVPRHTVATWGADCLCWRKKGYIDDWLAERRASRNQEQSQ